MKIKKKFYIENIVMMLEASDIDLIQLIYTMLIIKKRGK